MYDSLRNTYGSRQGLFLSNTHFDPMKMTTSLVVYDYFRREQKGEQKGDRNNSAGKLRFLRL